MRGTSCAKKKYEDTKPLFALSFSETYIVLRGIRRATASVRLLHNAALDHGSCPTLTKLFPALWHFPLAGGFGWPRDLGPEILDCCRSRRPRVKHRRRPLLRKHNSNSAIHIVFKVARWLSSDMSQTDSARVAGWMWGTVNPDHQTRVPIPRAEVASCFANSVAIW